MKSKLALRLGLVAVMTALVAAAWAQNANRRFGRWKLKSDEPPPALNIMTYEPYGEGGMRVTVEATNAKGEKRKWGYVTMFDGKYRPMTGDTTTEETAVEVIDARTNKISNKTGDRVNVILNVLSEDGNRIENEYRNVDENGKVTVTHAVYERIQ
jgi:opacity protein-like surface antigen